MTVAEQIGTSVVIMTKYLMLSGLSPFALCIFSLDTATYSDDSHLLSVRERRVHVHMTGSANVISTGLSNQA